MSGVVLLGSEVHIGLEALFWGAVAVVVIYGGLYDACVGGVDVVLVEGYGVEKGVFSLGGPAPEGCRVDLPDGGEGAVRAGVDVGLDVGKSLMRDTLSAGCGED